MDAVRVRACAVSASSVARFSAEHRRSTSGGINCEGPGDQPHTPVFF